MFSKYYRYYSYYRFSRKLAKLAHRIGKSAFRQVVTLVVMLKSKNVPTFAKVSIIGVLGYLICPFDLIPDFLLGGLVDDLAAIALLIAETSIYMTKEIEAEIDRVMKQFNL